MRTRLSRPGRWFASPKLALALLVAATCLVFLATLVPQGDPGEPAVATWAAAHPVAESFVRIFGFHSAYTSPVFLVCTVLLAISTTVCSWKRTKVAARRYALVTRMTQEQARELAGRATFSVPISRGVSADALQVVSEAMRRRRTKVVVGDGYVGGGASALGILGSPVFHWALVLVFIALAWGQLTRAEGLMGVGEGEVESNEPASYGVLDSGAFYRWDGDLPSIGVDKVRFDNRIGGVDRGPTPTVVLYASDGSVLAKGEAYPNHPLRYKSFTVHANDYGLSAVVSLTSPQGESLGKATVLMDFSDAVVGATAPGEFSLTDANGVESVLATMTVPLDRTAAGDVRMLPKTPRATLTVTTTQGDTLAGPLTLAVGESVTLPGGATIRLDAIRYYARLSVVDDSSLGVLFFALLVALVGLTCSLLGRKFAVAVVAAEDDGGDRLDVWYRDWRGGASGRVAFEMLVRDAVGTSDDGRNT